MSASTIELIYRFIEAINRGGPEGDGFQFLAEDVEWRTPAEALEPAVFRGPDAIRRMWSSGSERPTLRLVELVDLGDAVFAAYVVRENGSGEEPQANLRFAVITIRDHRAVLVREYVNGTAALAAARLS